MQGLRWGFLFAVILVFGLSLRKPVFISLSSRQLHNSYVMPGRILHNDLFHNNDAIPNLPLIEKLITSEQDLPSSEQDLPSSEKAIPSANADACAGISDVNAHAGKNNAGTGEETFIAGKEATMANKINWLSLKQVEDSLRVKRKHILIDLYTEWCGWCKVMDKKTYTNANVADYLAKNFYAVKLDAETKREISWNGKRYFFNPGYRANDFSVFLTGGNLSYPTTVIIPADNGEPQPIPGYLEPKDFELIVKYFGEGKFGRVPFPEYQKNFKASW